MHGDEAADYESLSKLAHLVDTDSRVRRCKPEGETQCIRESTGEFDTNLEHIIRHQ